MTDQTDYPALYGEPVTERHARICREEGHAAHLINTRDTGVCPRCGDVTEPDPLADEKKLLDLVVGGLAEKRGDSDQDAHPRTLDEMRANRVEIPVRSELDRMTQAIADESAASLRSFASIAERRRGVRAAEAYFPAAAPPEGPQLVDRTRKLTNRQAIAIASAAISALYSDVREAQPYVSQAVRWALQNTEHSQGDREVVSQLAMLINVATRDFT
jgi:hypothetical protein